MEEARLGLSSAAARRVLFCHYARVRLPTISAIIAGAPRRFSAAAVAANQLAAPLFNYAAY